MAITGVKKYVCEYFTCIENDRSLIRENILQNELKLPPNFPFLLGKLVKKMLEKNPENRITMEKLLKDPWIDQSIPEIDLD